MIIEVVHLKVTDPLGFEAAVREAVEVFRRAQGCKGLHLQRCIEAPDEYEVIILWNTLEDHTETFRNGPLFQEWRALVSGFFAEAPRVQHFDVCMARVDF